MSNRRARPPRCTRALHAEQLEKRQLLVAEGALYSISESFDAAELPGTLSASIRWDDGSSSPAETSRVGSGGRLRFTFDYSLDSRGFFSGSNQARRESLELAGKIVLSRLTDTLSAIMPGGINTWSPNIRHPSAGAGLNVPLHHLPASLSVAANEIIVYVGSRDFPAGVRGLGGPGAAGSFGTPEFNKIVNSRGEPGALAGNPTDYAPAVGSVSFDVDSSTDWYFGANPDGIEPGQIDFVSVAAHELAHVLGFGIAPSWTRLVNSNSRFTGAASRAAYAGSGGVPVAGAHWADDVRGHDDRVPAMSSELHANTNRHLLTALDYAALDDMGWEVVDTGITVTSSHRFPDDGPADGTYSPELVLSSRMDGKFVAEIVHPLDSVAVTNVAPTLTVVGDQVVMAGQPLSITDLGTVTDPGYVNLLANPVTREKFRYTIDWGDGSPLTRGVANIDRTGNSSGRLTRGSFDAEHVYTAVGIHTVTVSVSDDDGGMDQQTFTVTVSPPPELVLELDQVAVSEAAGERAARLTIRRNGPGQQAPQTVNLRSSDQTEAELPNSVVIPAGEQAVNVFVRAVDDALLDGDISVELTASSAGLTDKTVALLVKDREELTAQLAAASVSEDSATGVSLTLHRSNTDSDDPLTVTIHGGDGWELQQPATVTIPAEQQTGTVTLIPIDDPDPEPPTALNIVFTAAGYVDDRVTLLIEDDEPPAFQNPHDPFDVSGSDGVQASDALQIVNELMRRAGQNFLDPRSEQPDGVFLDVNGDYQVTALDALIVINELPNRDSNGQPRAESQQQLTGIYPGIGFDPEEDDLAGVQDTGWIGRLN